MRGLAVRAATTYGHPHPDVTAYMAGIATLQYQLLRREFMLRHPEEEAPQDAPPLSRDWLDDLIELHLHDVRAIRQRISQQKPPE